MTPITKQTIAIIGSSSMIGTSIAKGLCRGNYRLLLFEGISEEALALFDEICSTVDGADVEFMDCTHLASWEADVIFIEYQEPVLKEISEKIKDVSAQKIVAFILGAEKNNFMKNVESYFPNSKVVGMIPSKSEPGNIILHSENTDALNVLQKMLSPAGFKVTLKELISK